MDEERFRVTKRNSFANDEYVRLNNIEIDGIPVEGDDRNLQKTVTMILNDLDIDVSSVQCPEMEYRITSN